MRKKNNGELLVVLLEVYRVAFRDTKWMREMIIILIIHESLLGPERRSPLLPS
jgi:hypothetical protein